VIELMRELKKKMFAGRLRRCVFQHPGCLKTHLPARLAALNLFLLVTVYLLEGRE
jgi:hypothetical protein